MFRNFLKAIAGDPNKREVQKHSHSVDAINALEPEYRALTDEALRAKTAEFRARLAEETAGITDPDELYKVEQAVLDDLLPEAFAAAREAAMRTLGLRAFDVQLMGGLVLHQGKIAEMRTGEGKTLVATFPAYLNALTGRGVHVVTVNDYLARRDARWMGQMYHALGLTVGVLQEAARTENGKKAFLFDPSKDAPQEDQRQLRLVDRQEAYAADITYGTNNEFGFDYLRDNMAYALEGRVQRGRYFSIVDEVDNILIDEARTPLIISGPAQEEPGLYQQLARVARQLKPEHYEIDERSRTIALTEIGEAQVEKLLGQPLRDPDRPEEVTADQARILGHLEQALRAEFLFKRNKDYLVEQNQIVIVDEFTGRKMIGRRWSDGLHQAVEAKENVAVQAESVTYATVTLQNYFRLYRKLAGMSGTALTEAEEFDKIYKLGVVAIPTNLEYQATRSDSQLVEVEYKEDGYKFKYFARKDDPEKKPVLWRRKDYPDLVFRTEEAKLRAIIQEILRRHLHGQPLLVGTTSVELSEHLAERLRPEALQRLAKVTLLRKAWFEKNNQEEDGRLITELAPLDQPLLELNQADLSKQLRDYGLSTNPAGEDNVARLLTYLDLPANAHAGLTTLLQAGLKPAVLNAKKHTEESQIIAGAGARGAVTIATNMAGRGVDIKLGGELAEEVITAVNRVLRKAGHADPYDYTTEQRRTALEQTPESEWGIYASECQHFLQTMADFEVVKQVGGLHVIGSERHEARRIDNQLRGRAARQGDPGSSQFYLSLGDDLMRRFGGQQVSDLMQRLKIDDSLPIQAGLVNRIIEGSQTRVEGYNFDTRKHLLEYDDVLNSQRNKIYAQRDRIFEKEDLTDDFLEMLTAEVNRRVDLSEGDEDGRWKLFAWLEETQPSIPIGAVDYYPSYMLDLLRRDLEDKTDKRAALLGLARAALEAERAHLKQAVEAQIDHAAERLEGQVKERRQAVEFALEELENAAEESGQAVEVRPAFKTISEVLGVQIQPTVEQVRNFDYKAFKKQIPDWAEAAVSARLRIALVLAIERRLGSSLGLGNTIRTDDNWDTVREQLLEASASVHAAKMERSLKEIETELKALPDAPTTGQLIATLIRMAFGTTTAFDQKHRRIRVRTLRLTYVYLAADSVAEWEAAELKEDILQHLRGALQALSQIWGEAEYRRLANTRLAELPAPVQAALPAAADTLTLAQLPAEGISATQTALGQRALTRVLREIMLYIVGGLWVDHLTSVEALRTSIGLEAYAQRDPLVAYKSKASETFQQLLVNMRAGVVGRAFTARPRPDAETAPARSADPDSPPGPATDTPPDAGTTAEDGAKRKRRRR